MKINIFSLINFHRLSFILALILLTFLLPVNFTFAQAVSSQASEEQSVVASNKVLVQDILPTISEEAETQTTVETEHFQITFSSKAAKIVNFFHKDNINALRNLTELADPDPLWFAVYLTPKSFTALKNAKFTITSEKKDNFTIVRASTPVELVTATGNQVAEIEKEFIFFNEIHYYKFTWRIKNFSSQNIVLQNLNFLPLTHIGPQADSLSPRAKASFQNFYRSGSKFKSYSIDSGHKSSFLSCRGNKSTIEEIAAPIQMLGMSSRFMVMALQPLHETQKLFIFPPSNKSLPAEQQLQMANFELAANSSKDLSFLVYTGPKVKDYVNVRQSPEMIQKYPDIKNVNENITEAFNFGITAPIRDAIVFILGLLYKLVPNYGVGIILFALFFRILFYPINEKQSQSVEKMKKVQPLLKEINEKYKDDPQEKQKKTMELYKKHKVNPLGGCLPMLIQLPIFIALYSAFSDSYELWKSPFISGWINDLSEPDTLFVFPNALPFLGGVHFHLLPIIMATSQMLQTRMTAVSEDPNQKMMMQIMPLILLFIFWKMPSGVVLYWTVFNLLMIVQQMLTRLRNKDKE